MPKVMKQASVEDLQLHQEWLARLDALLTDAEAWAKELDWSTRRIVTDLDDGPNGDYEAPALILQYETKRALLEPIASLAPPDTTGIVFLYIMPAYDDFAKIYYYESSWHIHRERGVTEYAPRALTKATFLETLSDLVRYAPRA